MRQELEAARARAVARGVAHDKVWFDPGLGFSKNARHSIELLARVAELGADGTRLVVGAGRKSFIRSLDGSAATDRLGGTIAASLWAARHGAQVLRVHDVAAVRQALLVEAALAQAAPAQLGSAQLGSAQIEAAQLSPAQAGCAEAPGAVPPRAAVAAASSASPATLEARPT